MKIDEKKQSCPLKQRQLLEEYFLEVRAKILDVAAFLDRFDRSIDRNAEDDFRIVAMRQALQSLSSISPGRVYRIQMILSDPTIKPLPLDRKSAFGAYNDARSKVKQ